MNYKIAVLAGDGIGPEIVDQAIKVLKAVGEKFNHSFEFEHALVGATAIDAVGDPFPEETFQLCMNSDAVLFGAIGDPKYDNDPKAKVRPEQGLLAMRKKLTTLVFTTASGRSAGPRVACALPSRTLSFQMRGWPPLARCSSNCRVSSRRLSRPGGGW